MYELDFTLENPENSPWWMSRLIWLMDSAPDLALELWNSPKHEKLLEEMDRAATLAAYLVASSLKGLPQDIQQEMIAQAVCPADVDEPESELPEKTRLKILHWAENTTFPNSPGEDVRLFTIITV